jgi:hypothetical protein
VQTGNHVAWQHEVGIGAANVVVVVEQPLDLLCVPDLIAVKPQALIGVLVEEVVQAVDAASISHSRQTNVGGDEEVLRFPPSLRSLVDPVRQLGPELGEEPGLVERHPVEVLFVLALENAVPRPPCSSLEVEITLEARLPAPVWPVAKDLDTRTELGDGQ